MKTRAQLQKQNDRLKEQLRSLRTRVSKAGYSDRLINEVLGHLRKTEAMMDTHGNDRLERLISINRLRISYLNLAFRAGAFPKRPLTIAGQGASSR